MRSAMTAGVEMFYVFEREGAGGAQTRVEGVVWSRQEERRVMNDTLIGSGASNLDLPL